MKRLQKGIPQYRYSNKEEEIIWSNVEGVPYPQSSENVKKIQDALIAAGYRKREYGNLTATISRLKREHGIPIRHHKKHSVRKAINASKPKDAKPSTMRQRLEPIFDLIVQELESAFAGDIAEKAELQKEVESLKEKLKERDELLYDLRDVREAVEKFQGKVLNGGNGGRSSFCGAIFAGHGRMM